MAEDDEEERAEGGDAGGDDDDVDFEGVPEEVFGRFPWGGKLVWRVQMGVES